MSLICKIRARVAKYLPFQRYLASILLPIANDNTWHRYMCVRCRYRYICSD